MTNEARAEPNLSELCLARRNKTKSKMRIAVLALQGAFIEHEQMLARLGVESFEVRQLADWQQPKDGLIIPGGESTTQMKLLRELGLAGPVRDAIESGLPILFIKIFPCKFLSKL